MLKKRKILYKTYMSIVDEKNIYLFDENNKKVENIDSFLSMFETRKGSKGIYLYFNNVKRPIMDSDGIPLTSDDFFKEYCCDLNWAKTEPFCASTTPVPSSTPAPTGRTPSPTPTLNTSITYVETTATGQDVTNGTLIKYGMKGDIVEKIQKYLNTHGASLKTDGKFGPKTKKAVESFQSKKNLKVDGVVGPKTWLELVKDPTITPKPSPTPIKPEEDDFKQETIYGSEEDSFSFPSIIQTIGSTGYGD